MLISQAIKTFRLINKEKAYKRKECQTGEEEGGLKRRLTKGRNAGDQTPAEGVEIMLLSVCLWSFVGFYLCVCVKVFVYEAEVIMSDIVQPFHVVSGVCFLITASAMSGRLLIFFLHVIIFNRVIY